jgi:TonB family protein
MGHIIVSFLVLMGINPGVAAAVEIPLAYNESPKVIHRAAPRFPSYALARREAGCVRLAFIVDVNGEPRDFEVLESQPAGVFDPYVVRALRNWRFESVERPVRVVQTLTFNMPVRGPLGDLDPPACSPTGNARRAHAFDWKVLP